MLGIQGDDMLILTVVLGVVVGLDVVLVWWMVWRQSRDPESTVMKTGVVYACLLSMMFPWLGVMGLRPLWRDAVGDAHLDILKTIELVGIVILVVGWVALLVVWVQMVFESARKPAESRETFAIFALTNTLLLPFCVFLVMAVTSWLISHLSPIFPA